jgi:Zn-dependent peptidase ImmA (M78 family)
MTVRSLPRLFRRGFKTWCETVASQKRRALKVSSASHLDPRLLAKEMGVRVVEIDEIPDLAEGTFQQLTVEDPESWSAATVCWKGRYLVVMNSAHSEARRASSLMHELAHILIGHKPARLDVTPDGLMILSSYDKQNEDEANWLAAALMLPREALLLIRRRRMSNEQAALAFGCSVQMLKFRLNTTGVDIQLRRSKQKR